MFVEQKKQSVRNWLINDGPSQEFYAAGKKHNMAPHVLIWICMNTGYYTRICVCVFLSLMSCQLISIPLCLDTILLTPDTTKLITHTKCFSTNPPFPFDLCA